jgi:hypothetical protein
MEQLQTERSEAHTGMKAKGDERSCARSWWALLGCALMLTWASCLAVSEAADITPGYTFTPGERNITDVKLNAASAGTVATTFYTTKSADTAVNADTLLFYSASGSAFKKTTVQTLFNNVPQLLSLGTVASTGDFSVNTSKFTVSATTGNTAVSGNLTVASNLTVTGTSVFGGPMTVGTLTVTNGSTLAGGAAASGSWAWLSGAITLNSGVPLTVAGQQTNTADMVLGTTNTNTVTINATLAGTLQGTPTVSLTTKASAVGADAVLLKDSADTNKLKTVLVSALGPLTFTTNASVTAGLPINMAHGLGGVPDAFQVLFLCTNADAGYVAGDYVPAYQMSENTYAGLRTGGGANATNVWALVNNVALYTFNKTNPAGGFSAITVTNWNVVVKATRNR